MPKQTLVGVELDHLVVVQDVHLNPGDFPYDLLRAKDKADELGCPAVWNGDVFNALPYGMKKWRSHGGAGTCNAVENCIPEEGAYFIVGNHEGKYGWVQELVRYNPRIQVLRNLRATVGGKQYFITHGHRLTEWRVLRHIADDWVEFVSSSWITRRLWYTFSRLMGWMPGSHPKKKQSVENKWHGFYWGAAYWKAVSVGATLVVGHSHEKAWLATAYGLKVLDFGKEIVGVL